MKEFMLVPEVSRFNTFAEFAQEFQLCEEDMILTNEYIYDPFIIKANVPCKLVFQEKYGSGEPTDVMIDALMEVSNQLNCKRIIAVGGGTVLDIAKFLTLKDVKNSDEAFERKDSLEKIRQLIAVPTTCGTGSEMTNIAVVNRTKLGTKQGITSRATYTDHAVLIPEFLSGLPYNAFATSAIDALVHAVESYLAPTSTVSMEIFGTHAMKLIIEGFMVIARDGKDARFERNWEFLQGSNHAGFAFSNTSTGAVHAISYALGGKYHVPHGESNAQFFLPVLKLYKKKAPGGKIEKLEKVIQDILDTKEDGFEELDLLIKKIYERKSLREYGFVESDILEFSQSTLDNQQRLLKNNYVPLDFSEIADIYRERY